MKKYEGRKALDKNSKQMKRITITLTPEQLSLLDEVCKNNGYETMSRTIRVLVNKYAKKELHKQQ